MKVSVVVPAFNEEAYIGDCIDWLHAQTVAPFEIIVVNNNSSDKTARIARKKGARVINELTPGITAARNAGFNAARGDIIARCDADTRPHPDWVARIEASFHKENVVGVTGTTEFYDAPEELKSVIEKVFTVAYFQGSKSMIGGVTLYGSNMAIRTSAWERIKDEICLDDALVHEDIDLTIHLMKHGKIIYDSHLTVANSYRALHVSLPVIVERLAKWPRSKIVHTRLKPLARPGRKHSSTAQNLKRRKTNS